MTPRFANGLNRHWNLSGRFGRERAEALRLTCAVVSMATSAVPMAQRCRHSANAAATAQARQPAVRRCASPIPARVEIGLVYATARRLGDYVWNSAYDSEQQLHLDAAYPGVDRSYYIRTGSGSNAVEATNQMLDRGELGHGRHHHRVAA